MTISRMIPLGIVFGALISFGMSARAESVSYVTTGEFFVDGSSVGSTYTAPGVVINFVPSTGNDVTVPPASQVSFGQFDSTGTTASTFQGLSAQFVLSIFQITPTVGGPLAFVGNLTGQLRANNSQAYVLFSGPLTQSIGPVIYSIIEADEGILGRANIAPPSTNSGLSSVEGMVNVVPEPSALALAALATPLPLVLLRRKRQATA